MEAEELLTCALDIGELMLVSGAEVGRVEDTVTRICKTYPNVARVDILSITACINATLVMTDGTSCTLTRRIIRYENNFNKVHLLNDLSRRITREALPLDKVRQELETIRKVKIYPKWIEYAAFVMIGAPFTLFFGGSWIDALIASVISCAAKLMLDICAKFHLNALLGNTVSSFVLCLMSFLCSYIKIGLNSDMIMIGCIMVLIPGIYFTNSVRDLMAGDTITGLLNIAWALAVALAIAIGYIAAALIMGGAV